MIFGLRISQCKDFGLCYQKFYLEDRIILGHCLFSNYFRACFSFSPLSVTITTIIDVEPAAVVNICIFSVNVAGLGRKTVLISKCELKSSVSE